MEKTQGTQKKAKKYLGVADTLISSDLVHSSTEITNLDNPDLATGFGLRSIELMRSLASLPPLPETREEVRNVSSTFNEDEKVKLFGLQATEIDWRLSNPSNFLFCTLHTRLNKQRDGRN